MSNTRTIHRDIAARIDEIVLTGETKTSLSREGSPRASNLNSIELSDLETIYVNQIPTLRHIPVRLRLSWLDFLTNTNEGVSQSQTAHKIGTSYRSLVKSHYEHLIGVRKYKLNEENSKSKTFEHWKAEEYAELWYQAASLKYSRKTVNETIEAVGIRAAKATI